MTSDSSGQVYDCSSSGPTAVSIRCEATLELGRSLTKELGLDQSVDTLGRWMAHHIAGLIQDAEKANAEERPAKMRACSEAILTLWKHRSEFPNGRRPFEELKPILRVLKSLDPEDDMPRYYSSAVFDAYETDEKDETKAWLKLIRGLDYTAKVLICYCLAQAAQTALDKSAKWVALAEAAGADDGVESPVLRVIMDEEDLLEASDPDEKTRKRLEERIGRLEEFTKMAMKLASELRQQVEHSAHAMGES